MEDADPKAVALTVAIVLVALTANGEIGRYLGLFGEGIEAYLDIFF